MDGVDLGRAVWVGPRIQEILDGLVVFEFDGFEEVFVPECAKFMAFAAVKEGYFGIVFGECEV